MLKSSITRGPRRTRKPPLTTNSKCCGQTSIIDQMNKPENSSSIVVIPKPMGVVPPKIQTKTPLSGPAVAPELRFEEVSNIYLDNPEYVYCITGDNYDNVHYSLVQFNGTLDKITIANTAAFLMKLSEDTSKIVSSIELYNFDGIRADYQYAQIKFLNNSDLIVLGSYTGILTFNKNEKKPIKIKDTEGNYFLARFNSQTGIASWVLPIIALGSQNIEIALDISDNIYLAGTYQGTFRLGPVGSPSLSSSLINDMFLAKVSAVGAIEWMRTSDKTLLSIGSIRAESIALNLSNGEQRMVLAGVCTNNFVYSNKDGTFLSVKNEYPNRVKSLMWVAQFNLSGDIIWMNTPTVPEVFLDALFPPDEPSSFITAYQIVYDFQDTLYIIGTLLGGFVFNPDIGIVGGEEDLIYIVSISTDGVWLKYNHLRVPISKNEVDWYPHLLYNERLYITTFGLGDINYNAESMITGKSSGNLMVWLNVLVDGVWNKFPLGYQANVPNASINVLPYKDDIILIGSYIITPTNTNGYIKRIKIT